MTEQVKPKFKMTDEAKEDLGKQLNEWFNTVFKEKVVIIECPYAMAVEYGTTPSKGNRMSADIVVDPENGQKITATRLKFRDWAAQRNSLSGRERIETGDRIYKKVMEEGMKPHPYIRPAVEDMKHTLIEDAIGLTSEEAVSSAYAYYLAARMKYYLESNGDNVTRELSKSIKVLPDLVAENALMLKSVDLSDDKYNWKPGQARK